MVWVTIAYVLIALWTLRAIRDQASAMEKSVAVARESADAALLNVKALIASERPWLLVNIEVHEYDPSVYVVRAVNKGKTPAELCEGHCSCGLQPINAFALPEDILDPFVAPTQALTVSGDTFEIRRINPESCLREDNRQGIDPKVLCVYGKILYWDMFTDRSQPNAKPYVTQWCFVYNSHGKFFHRAANGYTRHT